MRVTIPERFIDNGHALDAMWSSNTYEWGTPQKFFDALDREFHFTLDVCANPENAKCERYFSIEDDGLSQQWDGICWMNPPYGRVIGHWVKKAYLSSRSGATVVCLVPTRSETAYWHDWVMRAAEIRFLRGRLRFEGPHDKGHSAPFPAVLVVFRPTPTELAVSSVDIKALVARMDDS